MSDTPTPAVDVLPCPFCGETIPSDEFPVNINEGIGSEHGGEATPWYEVGCRSCNFGIGARTEGVAVAKWNRRAALPSAGVPDARERVITALEAADGWNPDAVSDDPHAHRAMVQEYERIADVVVGHLWPSHPQLAPSVGVGEYERGFRDARFRYDPALQYDTPLPHADARGEAVLVDAVVADLLKWRLRIENGDVLNALGARTLARSLLSLLPRADGPSREEVEAAIGEYGEACYDVGFADADRDLREAPVARRNAAYAALLALYRAPASLPVASGEALEIAREDRDAVERIGQMCALAGFGNPDGTAVGAVRVVLREVERLRSALPVASEPVAEK